MESPIELQESSIVLHVALQCSNLNGVTGMNSLRQ